MSTRWKAIKDAPGFLVSEYGDVRRAFSDTVRTLQTSINGYKFFAIHVDGKMKNIYVHSTVAKLFCKGRRKGRQVNHIDGDKTNNRADNLQWVTAKDNMRHAVRMGLHRKGKHKSDEEIQAMYLERDQYSQNRLAIRHDMSRTCVNMILNGKRRASAIWELKQLEGLALCDEMGKYRGKQVVL